jgi:putative transposase
MIDKLKSKHPMPMFCKQLNVAISGYSAYCNGKQPSPRQLEDLRFTAAIKVAHERGRRIYGASKIQSKLAVQGIAFGINRIKRLRKAAGIRCIHKRKLRVMTDSKHKLPIAPNLLNREFNQNANM